MKFIHFILSIYIIALSCLPCSDAVNDMDNKMVSVKTEDKSSADHREDSCSPFCICNCCHNSGFYKTAEYITSAIIKINSKNTKIEYSPVFLSGFHTSIWQPPKIC
ncbi:DUF6660 family protein [Flavobacterium aestuarii]|uniref:DUF6660 family protein n=1 Tax=Flavobacterium aestuarii TaxID=3149227 RepID=UPI003EBEE329